MTDKLFKEYAIADLSRYKEGAVGAAFLCCVYCFVSFYAVFISFNAAFVLKMIDLQGLRWRTEQEVVTGKGQFSCGAKRCEEFNDLQSFEVDFNYREVGEKKQALVKLRVCPECGRRLNYRHQRKKAKRRRAQEKEEEEKDEEERSREEQAAKRQRGSGAARGGGGGGETRALERCVDEPSPKAKAAAVSKQHGKSSAAAASPKDRGRANRKGSTPGGGAAAAAAPAPAERAAASSGGGGGSVWSVPVVAEKTIHDEFDDYFNDLMQ